MKPSVSKSNNKRNKNRNKRKSEKGPQIGKQKLSIDKLLDNADELMDNFEYEAAKKFSDRALKETPENDRALLTSGLIRLELNKIDEARQLFRKAIHLNPDVEHSKYMYLGQLLTGIEAINCFRKGCEIIQLKLEEQSTSACEPEVTEMDLSNGYCSIAEIYLTDECMSSEAEKECEECLKKAIEICSDNCDAYMLLASFYLSKNDQTSASENITKSVSLWLPTLKSHIENDSMEDPLEPCPISYNSRMNASKILIEVGKLDLAMEILEILLDEEDSVVEVWYFYGWANKLKGGEFLKNSKHCLQHALTIAKSLKYDDQEVLKHIQQLLEELVNVSENESDDEDEEDDNDDNNEEMQIN